MILITSRETPSCSVGDPNDRPPKCGSQQPSFHQSEQSHSSLRLLRIPRPLKPNLNAKTDEDTHDW